MLITCWGLFVGRQVAKIMNVPFSASVSLLGLRRGLALFAEEDDEQLRFRGAFIEGLVPMADALQEGVARLVGPRLAPLGPYDQSALEDIDEHRHGVLM